MLDFHTHALSTPPGAGIVCLPREVLLCPEGWAPAEGGLYAAGLHPWWLGEAGCDVDALLAGVERLLSYAEVVQVGECGFDRVHCAADGQRPDLELQREAFRRQVALSEAYGRGVTVHCVRAFDVLLAEHKQLRPRQRWTVHGFRGGAALARQLLDAGLDLSFGARYDEAAFETTPTDRRHRESDAE